MPEDHSVVPLNVGNIFKSYLTTLQAAECHSDELVTDAQLTLANIAAPPVAKDNTQGGVTTKVCTNYNGVETPAEVVEDGAGPSRRAGQVRSRTNNKVLSERLDSLEEEHVRKQKQLEMEQQAREVRGIHTWDYV